MRMISARLSGLKKKLLGEIHLVNSFKFIIITAVSKFFSFLIYPILSRHFTISDFGYYDIFIVFMTIASSLGLLGLDSMIYRFLHDDSLNKSKIQLVSNVLFTQFLMVILIFFVIYFCFLIDIIHIHNFKLNNKDFFFLGIALLGMVFYSISEVILKISAKVYNYAILLILNASIFLIFTYVAVKYFDVDMLTYLKLFAAIYFSLGILGLFLIRSYISLDDLKIINFEYLSYAIPLCLLTLIPLLQAFFFRNFILHYLNISNIGVYAAASKLTILYSLPALAVSNATIPILLRNSRDNNFHIIANKFIFFTLIVMSFCLFVFTIFSKDISILAFGKSYNETGLILSYLCLGLFLQSVNGIMSIGSLIRNGTSYRFFSSLIVMAISLFIGYRFVQSIGLTGLLIGILTGNLLQMAIDFLIAQRFFKIQWELLNIFIFIFLTFIFCILFQNTIDFSFKSKVLLLFLLTISSSTLYVNLVLKRQVVIPS